MFTCIDLKCVVFYLGWPVGCIIIRYLLNCSADKGCKLEEEFSGDQADRLGSRQAVGLAEQLGDLYCKVGCYSKALEAYQAQVMNTSFLFLLYWGVAILTSFFLCLFR